MHKPIHKVIPSIQKSSVHIQKGDNTSNNEINVYVTKHNGKHVCI